LEEETKMDLVEQKRKQREFALASVSEVSSSSSSASPGVGVFAGDRLQIRNESNHILLSVHLTDFQVGFCFGFFGISLDYLVCRVRFVMKCATNGVVIVMSLFLLLCIKMLLYVVVVYSYSG